MIFAALSDLIPSLIVTSLLLFALLSTCPLAKPVLYLTYTNSQ